MMLSHCKRASERVHQSGPLLFRTGTIRRLTVSSMEMAKVASYRSHRLRKYAFGWLHRLGTRYPSFVDTAYRGFSLCLTGVSEATAEPGDTASTGWPGLTCLRLTMVLRATIVQTTTDLKIRDKLS